MKQLTFFDLIPEEENKEEDLDLCETCRYCEQGCCSYNEPLGRYCVLGDAYEFKAPEIEPDPCLTCKYFEDCSHYNIDRYDSCIKGSNYIYDPEKKKPTVEGSEFSKIVEYIESRTGLNFIEDDLDIGEKHPHKCRVHKYLTFTLAKSRFFPDVHNGDLFISVGFEYKSPTIPYTGGGGPFMDVDSVVEFFKDKLERYASPLEYGRKKPEPQ